MDNNDLVQMASRLERFLEQGNYSAAKKLSKTIEKHNRSAGLAYRGVIALKQNDLVDAESCLLESYRINPKQTLALVNLLPIYVRKKDTKNLVAFGELAIEATPNNMTVIVNYALGLMQEQKFSKCVDLLLPHLDKEKPHVSVITGLISCYRQLYKTKEASELLELAKKFHPDIPEIKRLEADSSAEQEPRLALERFQESLKEKPDSIQTKWNMSLVQLRLEDFEEGWNNYDNGLLPEVGKIGRPIPKLFNPVDRIVDPDQIDPERWIVVVCEQGIGDQVLFFSTLTEFIMEYPKTILVAEKRMIGLLRRSFPKIPIYNYGFGPISGLSSTLIQGHIPLGSIQKRYRKKAEDYVYNFKPYLKPDESRAQVIRDQILSNVPKGNKLCGFSWKGGFWERSQKTKSIEIESWGPIFQVPGVTFVSLQYGNVDDDRDFVKSQFNNIKWISGIDFKKDLDGWLSLISACDHIVSVSTALVHFAGASGKPVDLLLSERGGPFVWGVDREQSLVYPTIKIHRQNPGEEIADYFRRIIPNLGINQ